MRSALILRLVDVTLLLLLSLMAASTVKVGPVEPPITDTLEDTGRVLEPVRIFIRADGTIHSAGADPSTLEAVIGNGAGAVEFIADRGAPARILADGGRAARAAGRRATFVVKRDKP